MSWEIPPYHSDSSYPESYYANCVSNSRKSKTLKGSLETDVCIIGAGFTGLSTAIFLAERGFRVIVLEGAKVGWGASGRNGGQAINGFSGSIDSIRNVLGDGSAQLAHEMFEEGVRLIEYLMEKHAIECDFKHGNLALAITARQARRLEREVTARQQNNQGDFEYLDQDSLAGHVGSQLYCGGYIDRKSGHLHPLKLALGEAGVLERLGGKIFESTPAVAVNEVPGKVEIKTPGGRIHCSRLVLGCNGYLNLKGHRVSRQILPVFSEIVATEPLPDELAREVMPSDASAFDVRFLPDYYRLSVDKRMLFGSSTDYGRPGKTKTGSRSLARMHKVFPLLENTSIDFAWRGKFAVTLNRLPQLGTIGPRIYYGHGYCGHGVNCSHLFGKLISEAIEGNTERFDVFAKMPQRKFPGGKHLHIPLTMAGAHFYQARDWLGF